MNKTYNLSEFIGFLVEKTGYKIPVLSGVLGLSKKTLYNWLNKEVVDVPRNTIVDLKPLLKNEYGIELGEITNKWIEVVEKSEEKPYYDMRNAGFSGTTNIGENKITYGESDVKEMVFDLTIQNKKLSERIKDLEAELRKLKGE
jgi:hypothetical protein